MFSAILFWSAFLTLGYIYVGYAVLMRVLSRVAARPVRRAAGTPSLTIVVTAFNEERGIKVKLDNLLSLHYPSEQFDVLVASDGSTDQTDSIVQAYGDPRVRLLRVEGRVGKTECQNQAVAACTGDLVVFTDATTIVETSALEAMSANFSDPEVGCVAAQLVYVGKGSNLTASGGTSYWGYETGLRVAESRLGSLIGVSGCLYAVRRSAYRRIRPDLISDFVIAMQMREQGLRAVLETGAVCFEETLDRSSQELSMRIRVAIRSIAALVSEAHLLNPFRYGLFAIELLSHKALRYASPFIWFLAIVSCIPLLDRPLYVVLFIGQMLVLLAGLAGFALHAHGAAMGLLSKPYYFLLTNFASLCAFIRYVRGERVRIWSPVR